MHFQTENDDMEGRRNFRCDGNWARGGRSNGRLGPLAIMSPAGGSRFSSGCLIQSHLLVAGELLVQGSACDPKLSRRRLSVAASRVECGQDQRLLCFSQ